jgi:hypothetical protein
LLRAVRLTLSQASGGPRPITSQEEG